MLIAFIKQSVDVHRHSTIFSEIFSSKPVMDIVKNIFGEEPCFINHSKISYKFNKHQMWFPHQDIAYKQNKLNKGITVCVHLENVSNDGGALCCYEGSHKKGFIEHDVLFSANESEPQIRAKRYSDYKKKVIQAEFGDILIFDFNTIHSSEGNLGSGYRPIFIFEVEKIQGVPLEEDGSNAITFNYQYPNEFRVFPCRIKKIVRNCIIFPIVKILFRWLNHFALLKGVKIKK